LTVSNYSTKNGPGIGLFWSMPKEWVIKVERLYDNIWSFICI
jgi:hypothetical protein